MIQDLKTPPQWVVSVEDKTRYDENFAKLDQDNDGFVTGLDVKDTLLNSGLPQNVLAHIWYYPNWRDMFRILLSFFISKGICATLREMEN